MTPEQSAAEWALYWSRFVKVDAEYVAYKCGTFVIDAKRTPELFRDITITHLKHAHQALGVALKILGEE